MRLALLIGVALLALLRFLPLSWVAGVTGLPGQASGTVWSGQLLDVPGMPPIAIETDVREFPVPVAFRSGAAGLSLAGRVGPSAARDVRVAGPVRALNPNDGRLQALLGDVTADIDEVDLDGVACVSATGRVTTDVLARNRGSLGWSGPVLTGPISCADGQLVAELAGRDGRGSVNARIAIDPSGPYRADVTVLTQDVRAGAVLPLYGFGETETGYRLSEAGRWR